MGGAFYGTGRRSARARRRCCAALVSQIPESACLPLILQSFAAALQHPVKLDCLETGSLKLFNKRVWRALFLSKARFFA
jgi:hypothetical protein